MRQCAFVGVVTIACCCAQPASGARLYGSEVIADVLVSIDRNDASASVIGPFFPTNTQGAIRGMAADIANEILFGLGDTPGSQQQIFQVNITNGALTPLVATGTTNPNGLAFDSSQGALYFTDNNTNGLYRVDLVASRGAGGGLSPAFVGTIGGGFSNVEGLAYDPFTDTLYGLADSSDQIIVIDKSNAGAVALATNPLGGGNWRGLTFDTNTQTLLATRVIGSPLAEIDPVTGAVTFLGDVAGPGVGGATQGLAFIPAPGTALVLGGLLGAGRRRRR